MVKSLRFSNITSSTASPFYGCGGGTVTYNLASYDCGQFCTPSYLPPQYNITWQPPSGWVQTNIGTNGNTVSFTPNATSSGALTATINLPCGYSEIRTFNIVRTPQAPTFSTSNSLTSCTSSTTLSINPTCGATNYTYSILNNAGVTFTSGGTQTLTTNNTSVTLSLPNSTSSYLLKVKANYSGNVSSTETESTYYVGAIAPFNLVVTGNCPDAGCGRFGRVVVNCDDVPSATQYNWYRDGVFQVSTSISQYTFTSIQLCDIDYIVDVEAVTSCGVSALSGVLVSFPPCGSFRIYSSPNPASDNMYVTIEDESMTSKEKINDQKIKIELYDFNSGQVIKQWSFDALENEFKLNVKELKKGQYILRIVRNKIQKTKQVIIN